MGSPSTYSLATPDSSPSETQLVAIVRGAHLGVPPNSLGSTSSIVGPGRSLPNVGFVATRSVQKQFAAVA